MPDPHTKQQTLSAEGLKQLERHEGVRARPYNDNHKRLGGNCTVGRGVKIHSGPCTPQDLKAKYSAVDVAAKEKLRLLEAERAVRRDVTVTLTTEQFDALVSLVYNMGPGSRGAGNAMKLVNEGKNADAAKWIKAHVTAHVTVDGKVKHVVLPGLIARRQYEAAPFESAVTK